MTPADHTRDDVQWVDDEAGLFVRPYALTRGRTRPTHGTFNLISIVLSNNSTPSISAGMGPEHLAIVTLCRKPMSVAEVSAHMNLPLGTIRVMLDDLLNAHLIQVHENPPTDATHPDLIEALIHGIRQL